MAGDGWEQVSVGRGGRAVGDVGVWVLVLSRSVSRESPGRDGKRS